MTATYLQKLCVVVALAVAKSRANTYGGPASCAANPGCAHLGDNDCCPTSWSGTFLDWCVDFATMFLLSHKDNCKFCSCPKETTSASCSANAGCASIAGLGGDCCPASDGKDLYCCYQNAEALYKREFTFYGHPNPSLNQATYFASTGAHMERDTSNGRIYTYERFGNFLFDLVYYQTNAIPNADDYVTGRKKFYLTIDSTNAPPCTEVLLQLDSLPDATDNNFPKGRHSRYLGTYTPDTKRFEFTFLDRPDPDVANNAVNSIALFFEPGIFVGETFQYSFLDSAVSCTASADSLPNETPVSPPPPPPTYAPVYPPPPTYSPVHPQPVYKPVHPPTYAPVYPPPPPPTHAPVKAPTHAPVHPPIAPGQYDPPSPSHPVAPVVYFQPIAPTPAPVWSPAFQPQSMTIGPARGGPVFQPQAMTNSPTMDDPVTRPVPVPVPIADDPVTRPVPMPVPIADDPVTRPVPMPVPIADDPVTRPVPAPLPIADDPVTRPVPAPVPIADDPVTRPVPATVPIADDPVTRPVPAPVPTPDDVVTRPTSRFLSEEPCLPPPVNQCMAYHVDAICSEMDDKTCNNPNCADTPGCGGGMVTSYLALEDRSILVEDTSVGNKVASMMALALCSVAFLL